ncbi:hypothetical protein BMS3Abin15_00561 [bacterium BMS3Abin15]|nr:hypothetical protein BMS3Abin15_00561 [bacterium BMS3Abin15]HDH07485.1 GxxExxY protein [Candidatus Moranbacteria bacterium]HDZ85100.1 GxxExxY protein [Candidatus Moranbacteria bacterium]
MKNKIIYKDLSYEIVGICFKLQDSLGRFCREKQYSDEFEKQLIKGKIKYHREVFINEIKNTDVKGNKADFIIEDKVIVDFKAKKFITKEDYYQMQRYLKFAELKLGLIINLRETYLKPKRVINNEYDKDASEVRGIRM